MMFLLFFSVVYAQEKPWEKEPLIPPPDEIRSTETQPNRLMLITYANGRTFAFEIKSMSPRSDCNEIQYDSKTDELKIIARGKSNSFEYILGSPIMFSRWITFSTKKK